MDAGVYQNPLDQNPLGLKMTLIVIKIPSTEMTGWSLNPVGKNDGVVRIPWAKMMGWSESPGQK